MGAESVIAIPAWLIGAFAGFAFGTALLVLASVALGAFVVFRTKRESYDPLFTLGASKGDAFNVADTEGLEDVASAFISGDDGSMPNDAPGAAQAASDRLKAAIEQKFNDQIKAGNA